MITIRRFSTAVTVAIDWRAIFIGLLLRRRSRVSASPRNSRHVALPPAYHLFTATFSAAKLAAANYRLEQGLPRLQ
ncbi:hypothetical protein T4D_761, partial [Trichinella pseudospiralis]